MGGSILSTTIPAATEVKHFCEVYFATGSREDGASSEPEASVCSSYHVVSSLSYKCRKEDPGRWEEI